jgi:Copper type II ascorbate-dependent monooxygenase, C-terminal domain
VVQIRPDYAGWGVLSLAIALAGCSAASPTGSTTAGKPEPSTPAANGTGGASGGAAETAPGFYAVAGTDLAAPVAGKGYQIATPDYDANDPNAMLMAVPPGQEVFLCYYLTLPNTGEVDVGGFQSYMTEGSSHHFIAYQVSGNGGPSVGMMQPSGTINTCSAGAGTWLYATSTPGEIIGFNMPEKVALPFAAGAQIMLNMHFINPGSTTLYPKVKLNLLSTTGAKYRAGTMVSFNQQINVPAATASGPGTQTVSGTCTAPVGSKFFSMSTHTHKHATAAVVQFVSGGSSEEIVHTGAASSYPADQQPGTGTDWEHPGVGTWLTPNYLTIQSGDSFTYSCSYQNDGNTAVVVGNTAATNEMCMAIGYYYPAGKATCN